MVEFLSSNWSYALIAILAIDKAVAMSPSKMDDLLWTIAKKAIRKIVGK
jgi:hypothetical protein